MVERHFDKGVQRGILVGLVKQRELLPGDDLDRERALLMLNEGLLFLDAEVLGLEYVAAATVASKHGPIEREAGV